MRIQHNILSMNAYRNYSNNTSALGKNLEKLSSGYKINRAGDDAAGLAISEKMRAQIKGLDAAQKNVKDSISFVKTAEGAMQEIQDMLSRMKYLATQSANGTYQDDVDREALQDEVDSLLEEIDRIAQSANFNDVHMLNGPEDGAGDDSAAVTVDDTALKAIQDKIKGAAPGNGFTDGSAGNSAPKQEIDFSGLKFEGEGNVEVTLGGQKFEVAVTKGMDGKGFATALAKSINDAAAATPAVKINDATGGDFTAAADATGKLTLTGANQATMTSANLFQDLDIKAKAADTAAAGGKAKAADAADAAKGPTFTENTTGKKLADFDLASIDLSGVKGITKDTAEADLDVKIAYDKNNTKLTVKVGGNTYEATIADAKAAGANKDITLKVAGDAAGAKGEIKVKTAGTITNLATDGADIAEASVGKAAPAADDGGDNGGGKTGDFTIKFQIGDTSDDYNQLQINIKSMSTASIKVASLKGTGIADIDSAGKAIQTIKDAINDVSSVRGQLGAWQNRLEHTANNLSVMHENIQDAESTIRDTDVADEMMAYTKNNILIQSAQAMLAQANAVPQGVLQLLQ